MRQFNGMDSLFLYMDAAHAGMHGAFLQIYAPLAGEDAAQRYARLLKYFEGRLDAASLFRRAMRRSPLDLDHAWWVDGVDVDLHYHVRHTALPQPGNAAQLADAYARIYAQAMDMSRPLWEIHVIDGVNRVEGIPTGAFALVVKFHHAGADGISATEITSALHSTVPKREKFSSRSRRRENLPDPPALGETMRHSALLSARFGRALGNELVSRAPALARKLIKRALPGSAADRAPGRGRNSAPRSLINVAVSTDRSYTWASLNLDEIKQIREQVTGATVNDVYLAVVGAALRKFLQSRDGLPRKSLIAAVPMSVRSEDERGQAGNQFTVMPVPLRTDEPDAARRLHRIVEAATAAKHSMRGGGGRRSANWFKIIPAPLLLMAGTAMRLTRFTARMAPLFNLIVTNVPGPRQTLYLDGAQLLEINGAPPVMDGLGLIIAASSYDNALRVAVGACRKVMPEPEQMRHYLLASFSELKQAFGVAPGAALNARKRSKPATRKPAATRRKKRET